MDNVMEPEFNLDEYLKGIPTAVNELSSLINQLYSMRYKYLIYKLLRGGHVRMVDVVEASGVSEVTIRTMIDQVDKIINK